MLTVGLILLVVGVGVNIAVLTRPVKNFARFSKTCEGCGCQTPPMYFPLASHECPMCEWRKQHPEMR